MTLLEDLGNALNPRPIGKGLLPGDICPDCGENIFTGTGARTATGVNSGR